MKTPMMAIGPDAVVIGAGPNGLVAANVLADAGWKVVVLEAADRPGGAVRTEELTAPGFRNDVFSAFYPLAAASPVLADLHLHRDGLRWTHSPKVLAHARPHAPAAVLSRNLDTTVESLNTDRAGDGEAYRRLYARWRTISSPAVGALLRPFPPVREAARLLRAGGIDGTADLARMSLLSLRRMTEEEFSGEAAALLFAGNALHADLTPDMSGSALFGWLLVSLGQQVGFPVPVGGAEEITRALHRRASARDVEVHCGQRVRSIDVREGKVCGVTTDDGTATRCPIVLADCDAITLVFDIVGAEHFPAGYLSGLRRFQRAASTFKIDWALSSPVPWSDPAVVGAGTVHIADSLDELTITTAQLAMRRIPDKPFLLVGQMTTSDSTRSPAGTESLWTYTHVPQHPACDAGPDGLTGAWTDREVEIFADRMEQRIEDKAPGFRSRILARHVMSPRDLQARNPNLIGGDISGGTAQIHQQLIFRPARGMARAETPVPGLFLASASAHPGGGVHGACGANAARAALLHHPLRGRTRRPLRRHR
jgi:phytoene dehydrogenase-like protein